MNATLPDGHGHGPVRPVHLTWRYLGLVAAGGTVGTALRALVTIAIPPLGHFPVATFGINILGAFLLGALLEALARRGPDEGRRRVVRLLVGTGVLGGFTTYSALAVDANMLLTRDTVGTALLYSLGTIVLGAVATWVGIALSAALHRRRDARKTPESGVGR